MGETHLDGGLKWPQKTDYRIGICGAGGIVRDAHLPAYRKAGFKVVGLYDPDTGKAEALAATFGIERVCTSLDELAAGADIVDIAVPATANRSVVDQVSGLGKPMLIQKPLAEDWQTAKETVELIESRGVVAAVNQQMRWEPGVRASRVLLDRGDLGQLFNLAFLIFVQTPWHMWEWLKSKSTIDVLYHSIHYLDTIRFLSGQEPLALFCDGSRSPGYDAKGETRLSLHLRFADQLRASILTNHHAPGNQEAQQSEFRLDGNQGAVRRTLGLLMDYPRGAEDAFGFTEGEGWKQLRFAGAWFPDAFIGPMASLMQALNGEIDRPETEVRDNLQTLRLVFAAYESIRSGEVVQLDNFKG